MAISKKPYKGTRDLFPLDKRVQNYMFSIMKKTAESFGYEPYDGPMLEEVELYKAKSGEELIAEQIYSFHDRGERFVAIRPEMTPTVARMVAQIHREQSKPIRWYSIPNLMRYERPQRGRLREHWQLNCDIFGSPDGFGEIEMIHLLETLFKNFGASSHFFEIHFNDRKFIDAFFEKLEIDPQKAYQLYKVIDRSKKMTEQKLLENIQELGLSSQSNDFIIQYLKLENDQLENFCQKVGLDEYYKRIEAFQKTLHDSGVESKALFDPCIVRGLDYYTGFVFEIFDTHPDNNRALCGGGSYEDLLKIFNEQPLPGCGFGLGDVTLQNFLEGHHLLPNFETQEVNLFMSFQDEFENHTATLMKLSRELRRRGKKVLFYPEKIKFKKAFSLSEKNGAKAVALIGSDEVKNSEIRIKNLSSSEQKNFSHSDYDSISEFLD